MSVNNNTDYKSLLNQQKLNRANAILGGGGGTGLAGMSGDLIQQWAMRGANSAAYRKLLAAEELGTIRTNKNYSDIMSDKLFNDYYDPKKSEVTKAIYKPVNSDAMVIAEEKTSGDVLDDMQRLALAAANNPGGLNATQHDFFETMRASIANNLVTGKEDAPQTITSEKAETAKVVKKTDFHLLTEQQNFTVAGAKGEKNYNFNEGDSLVNVVAAINADTETTGVKAEWVKRDDGGYEVQLTSAETGKDNFVRIDQNVGTLFTNPGESLRDAGKDAVTTEAETVAKGEDARAAMAVGAYRGELFGDEAFTIAGAKGSQQFQFTGGTSIEDVAKAINDASAATGVSAEIIRNSAGEIEGLGLLAEKSGSGQFVQATQDAGDLFAAAGKTVKVQGRTDSADSSGNPGIASLSDLGQATVDGKTYSFADLARGGAASLENNPDAAVAVLEQAMRDIHEGRAIINGYDPMTSAPKSDYSVGVPASTNTMEIGNFGSDAMTRWLSTYVKEAAAE